ncbi:DNA polymerase delta small subunit [Porphyridium purpureum]|uniref:DNA polymerase delta small subunit n=1 Tax=Porphyridium purpureum TaxID=35688 RepID=A0A5J4YTP6_PORPP|nr:DNA polymerase delta small subunit [Porphyridium purpureum]|eukprot:POR0447..scf229_5
MALAFSGRECMEIYHDRSRAFWGRDTTFSRATAPRAPCWELLRLQQLRGAVLAAVECDAVAHGDVLVGVLEKERGSVRALRHEGGAQTSQTLQLESAAVLPRHAGFALAGAAAMARHGGDPLYVRDEPGRRVRVVGAASALHIEQQLRRMATGVVAAFCGTVEQDAFGTVFSISRIFPPGPAMSPHVRVSSSNSEVKSSRDALMFLSGLEFGDPQYSPRVLAMLVEYVRSSVARRERGSAQSLPPTRIRRVVIAGHSLARSAYASTHQLHAPSAAEAQLAAAHVREFDRFLCELCELVPVDLMPNGSSESASLGLPQSSLSPLLFPRARLLRNFALKTNPYCFDLDSLRVCGTCGENVRDVQRCTGEPPLGTLDALELMLTFRHLAPSSYPSVSATAAATDVFVLEHTPNVLFTANMPDGFQTRIVECAATGSGAMRRRNVEETRETDKEAETEPSFRCLLLGLPSFSLTQCSVLVDLENLDTRVVEIV